MIRAHIITGIGCIVFFVISIIIGLLDNLIIKKYFIPDPDHKIHDILAEMIVIGGIASSVCLGLTILLGIIGF